MRKIAVMGAFGAVGSEGQPANDRAGAEFLAQRIDGVFARLFAADVLVDEIAMIGGFRGDEIGGRNAEQTKAGRRPTPSPASARATRNSRVASWVGSKPERRARAQV